MKKRTAILDPKKRLTPAPPRTKKPKVQPGWSPTGDENPLLKAANKPVVAPPRTKPVKAPSMKASVVSPMTPGQKLASNVTNTTGNERDGKKYDVRTDAQGRLVHVYRDPKIKPVVIVPKKKKTW